MITWLHFLWNSFRTTENIRVDLLRKFILFNLTPLLFFISDFLWRFWCNLSWRSSVSPHEAIFAPKTYNNKQFVAYKHLVERDVVSGQIKQFGLYICISFFSDLGTEIICWMMIKTIKKSFWWSEITCDVVTEFNSQRDYHFISFVFLEKLFQICPHPHSMLHEQNGFLQQSIIYKKMPGCVVFSCRKARGQFKHGLWPAI